MKKLCMSCIIIIILTNFIFCNRCYAGLQDEGSDSAQETFEEMNDNSTADVKGNQMSLDSMGPSGTGSIVGVIISAINAVPLSVQFLTSLSIASIGIDEENLSADDTILFSIENIITGKYLLFEANIFSNLDNRNYSGISNVIHTIASASNPMITLRENVTIWFSVIKDVATATNLCILVFIAIKMAIATVAKDRAKYKEMLYNWVVSMLIIFLLPYIMASIGAVSDLLVDFFRGLMEAMPTDSFEKVIMTDLLDSIVTGSGFRVAYSSLLYWILLWNEIKFLLTYMKRMLTSYFLVIISPFITVTYSIDKLGDGKAQAFSKWFREYSLNMFMQPIHCMTYLIFMYLANNIAVRAPLVGLIFLMSMPKAQKIIVSVLGLSASAMNQAGDKMSVKGMAGKLKGMVPKVGGK